MLIDIYENQSQIESFPLKETVIQFFDLVFNIKRPQEVQRAQKYLSVHFSYFKPKQLNDVSFNIHYLVLNIIFLKGSKLKTFSNKIY